MELQHVFGTEVHGDSRLARMAMLSLSTPCILDSTIRVIISYAKDPTENYVMVDFSNEGEPFTDDTVCWVTNNQGEPLGDFVGLDVAFEFVAGLLTQDFYEAWNEGY